MELAVLTNDNDCCVSHPCVSIYLYADDIIAPSVQDELRMLDMQVNANKFICIRFG